MCSGEVQVLALVCCLGGSSVASSLTSWTQPTPVQSCWVLLVRLNSHHGVTLFCKTMTVNQASCSTLGTLIVTLSSRRQSEASLQLV